MMEKEEERPGCSVKTIKNRVLSPFSLKNTAEGRWSSACETSRGQNCNKKGGSNFD
jgi:hypothetical protein